MRRWVMPVSGRRSAAAEHVVEVHQRLAHAHEDEVVDRLDAAEVQDLVEDLVGGQVAAELHRARGAEGAGQRAAGLAGDADGAPAVAVAHQHRLDRTPVAGVEQRLDRAVAGLGGAHGIEGRERDVLLQPRPQARRAGRSSPRRTSLRATSSCQICRARKARRSVASDVHACEAREHAPRQVPRPCGRRVPARRRAARVRGAGQRGRRRRHRSGPRRGRRQRRRGRRRAAR